MKKRNNFLREFLPVRKKLLAFVFSMVPNYSLAEDIFQEASIVLWEKFDTFDPGTNFQAWARKVIYNKVMNERTRKKNEMLWDPEFFKAVDRGFRKNEKTESSRFSEALSICMERLSEAHQKIMRLKYYNKMSYREIGRCLRRSENGTKVMARKIRKILGNCIQEQVGL